MSALVKQLQALAADFFLDEDGARHQIQLLPGLPQIQLDEFISRLPNGYLPKEIEDLLLFARGFDNSPISEEVRFDAFGDVGPEILFPYSIGLTGDGSGDYWILDINEAGQWGAVFYFSHEFPVIIRQSDSLSEFLGYVHSSSKSINSPGFVDRDCQTAHQVWQNRKKRSGLIKADVAAVSGDSLLRQFAAKVPANYLIADLRKSSAIRGFVCRQVLAEKAKVYRHGIEPIWAFEPSRPNWLSRLFSRR